MPIKLVVFDFSGTLSLEAARFAAPARLLIELERSGLAALGVKTPAFFWDEIVNPTWSEGSTTAAGYQKVMAERIGEIFHSDPAVAASAVTDFVRAYFKASRIDPRWRPALARLAANPSVQTVIASDHYAEATGAIRRGLEDMGISAISVGDEGRHLRQGHFIIATSADIGFHKATEPFWMAVKNRIGPERVGRILLVDDFGVHEQAGDDYASEGKLQIRRIETETVLQKVFSAAVEVFPFIVRDKKPHGTADDDSLQELIGMASAGIYHFLEP